MFANPFKPTYSKQDLIDAVQNNKYIQVRRGYLNKLKMAKTKLEGVFGKRQALGYFTCKGVKRCHYPDLVMIGYEMRLENSINWHQAERSFQSFLARLLKIDESSVDIEGIIWDANSCWYIMNATPALIQAPLIDKAIKSNSNSKDWKLETGDIVVLSFVSIAGIAGIAALIKIVFLKH